MNVSVDQPRRRVRSAGIDLLLPAVVVAKSHDQPVGDRDGARPDGPGEDIHNLTVVDDQIGRDTMHGRVNYTDECFLVHMFHKTASFFNSDANNSRLNDPRLRRRNLHARLLSDLFRRNSTFYCK